MPAGSIILDLLMRTGSFVTDTERASKQLKKFQKDAIGTASSIKTQLVTALAAVGVTLSFNSLVEGAARLKDLEEEVGDTAENLGSLSVAAGTAGVELGSIVAAANRLSASLTDVDDESTKVGAALTSLGIPIEEFKRLDPVARVDALAAAFNSFADGPKKSAAAIALFGKSGAEQLRVFKALEEAGGRQVILTQQQIEQADAFADAQSKARAQLLAYAQAAATELIPSLTLLTTAAKEVIAEFTGIDSSGRKLAGNSPMKEFGEGAVNVLAFVADAAQGVVRVFNTIGTAIGGAAAAAVAAGSGEFSAALEIARQTREDIDKILSAELFSQRIARLRSAAEEAARNGGGFNDRRFENDRKPELNFDGKDTTKKKDKSQSEAERYLETLKKQAEATLELTSLEQALLDIEEGRLKGLTPALQKAILAQAEFNDLNKQAIDLRTAEVSALSAASKTRLEDLDRLRESNKELRDEIDLMRLDSIGVLGVERARTSSARAIKEETLARMEAQGVAEEQLQVLQAEIAALREREELLGAKIGRGLEIRSEEAAQKSGEKISTALSDSIEQGLLEGFRRGGSLAEVFINELKAQFAKTILRPIIQPIAEKTSSGFSDLLNQFVQAYADQGITSGDSQFSQTGADIRGRRAGGGDVHPGGGYMVGENGPEWFSPSTSGRILPNSAMGGRSPQVVIENHGARTEQRRESNGDLRIIVEAAVSEVDRRIMGNGSTAAALRSKGLSLSGGLPKRT